jgi:hypothetical protein
MGRKVTATVTVKVTTDLEEGVNMQDALSDMDYNFFPDPNHGNLVDQEITAMEFTPWAIKHSCSN